MKKGISLVILILFFYSLHIDVKAAENLWKLDPEKRTLLASETIIINVVSNTSSVITEGSFNVVSDSAYMNLVSVVSDLAEITETNHKVNFKAQKGISKGDVLAVVTYKSLANTPNKTTANINISNIFVTLKNKEEVQIPNISASVNVNTQNITNKTNTLLAELSSEDTKIPFDSSILEYKITVPNEIKKLILKAVPSDSNMTVAISSAILQEGSNEITITVKGTGIEQTIYKLSVTREVGKEEKTVTLGIDKSKMYIFLALSIVIIILDIIYLINKKIRG